MIATITNVYASGPRLDYSNDDTEEGAYCWVDGFDAGFAGKYDKNRAKECLENGQDEYNASWGFACTNGGHSSSYLSGFDSRLTYCLRCGTKL